MLAILDSAHWLEDGVVKLVLRDRDRFFLKTCILKQITSDAVAAQVLYGRSESVSASPMSSCARRHHRWVLNNSMMWMS